MTRVTPTFIVALASAFFVAGPAAAQAPRIHDTVYRPSAAAHTSAHPAWRFTAPDGHVIRLKLSESIGKTPTSIARAESYALMLEGNLHSYEMSKLTIFVVRANELSTVCGGDALACYGQDEMVVPYSEVPGVQGVSVDEIITHEYGHHLAFYRGNSLGEAIDWGPQSWASAEAVCYGTDSGQLFPGDEWDHYWENPGEGWAEAYARYHFRNDSWDYSRLLKPDARAFDRVAFDSTHQLSETPSTTEFHGELGPGRRTQAFSLTLAEDSALKLALSGPAGSNYDLRLKTPGYYDETTRARGSRDRMNTTACFAEAARRTVKIRVTRKSGSGPFSLKASYFDRYDELG